MLEEGEKGKEGRGEGNGGERGLKRVTVRLLNKVVRSVVEVKGPS